MTTLERFRDASWIAVSAMLSGASAMAAPGFAPNSPRTVPLNPPVDEDLFVTPQRQAAAAVSLVLRLMLWPLFLLRELVMLPRRCAGCNVQHPGQDSAVCCDGVWNPQSHAAPGRIQAQGPSRSAEHIEACMLVQHVN